MANKHAFDKLVDRARRPAWQAQLLISQRLDQTNALAGTLAEQRDDLSLGLRSHARAFHHRSLPRRLTQRRARHPLVQGIAFGHVLGILAGATTDRVRQHVTSCQRGM